MTNFIKNFSYPIAISLLAIVFFTSVAAAQDGRGGRSDKGAQAFEGVRAMKQLDLTDEQKAQIKELSAQRKTASVDFRTQQQEIRDLVEAGDVNAAAEVAATQARTRVTNMAEQKMAFEAILTAEQLEQLKTQQAERQLKREQRIEKRQSRRDSSDS